MGNISPCLALLPFPSRFPLPSVRPRVATLNSTRFQIHSRELFSFASRINTPDSTAQGAGTKSLEVFLITKIHQQYSVALITCFDCIDSWQSAPVGDTHLVSNEHLICWNEHSFDVCSKLRMGAQLILLNSGTHRRKRTLHGTCSIKCFRARNKRVISEMFICLFFFHCLQSLFV